MDTTDRVRCMHVNVYYSHDVHNKTALTTGGQKSSTIAVERDQIDVVNMLITEGANVDAEDRVRNW